MAFYDPTMYEVHVLLVDHDMNSLNETARLLQFNSYKVTLVLDASIASSILSQGDTKYNAVMVDVQLAEIEGFKLVHEATSMGLPVFVMSNNANPILVKSAIEDGAFLFMQNPPSQEELKYLWQHIFREETRKNNAKGKSILETAPAYNYHNRNSYISRGENSSMNRATGQKGRREIISLGSDNNINNGTGMKPKMCTEWTLELHEKFMVAVKILGDGRCFPKDILELMNVPGLTRMQVASHLQKCRHGWQPSGERPGRHQKAPKSLKPNPNRQKKYGILPRLIRGSQPQFPPKENQINEQANVAIRNNVNMENPIILPDLDGTQNIGQQGTWVDVTYPNNNKVNYMNEIYSNENVFNGQLLFGQADHMLQPEASFGFTASDDGLIANNFSLNEFDLDCAFLGQAYNITDATASTFLVAADGADTAAAMDSGFWNPWFSNFPKELEERELLQKAN